ncbi:hypothetical protein COU75_04030 [Candidatus Peregrinibacteria bacterium CG10_big_fil_rev_8_21_14_0_10_42_8]|nr:MAG: hypothetical protein COU75_04030 [Candidatus Peregrinibacteria bacterium CG10_big_fil_rev_8_21_14_0_10_42_8]
MRSTIFSLVLLVTLMWSFGYMRPAWGYNQATRLDVLHAVFTEGTIAIDSFHENTGDKIEWNGHYYSEKAPGVVVIAAPAFATIYAILGALSIDINGDLGWKISEWFTTVFSVGLLAAVSALFLFALLKKYTHSYAAFVSTVALYTGSLVFTYAGMLFSHTVTVSLLIIALWAIDSSVGLISQGNHSRRHSLLAGLCLGLAIACEYTSTLSAGAILLFVLLKNRRMSVYLLAGSIAPLLLIPFNNFLISGAVLSLPYEHVTDFPGMKKGFFGIQLQPNIAVMWQLLGSQYRGLFFWSPFLLLCIPGYKYMWHKSKAAVALFGIAPVLSVVIISSYSYWHGGWALGPRHLAAAIPFLILPAAFGCQKFPRTGFVLGFLSIALTSIGTVLQPLAPEGNLHPLTHLYVPMLLKGEVRENLSSLLGLHSVMSLVVLYVVFFLLLSLTWKFIDTKTIKS